MTVSILQLWLPIILGGIAAWMASGVIHMVLKFHNGEYQKLDNEDQVRDAVRAGKPGLGLYHFPHCLDPKEFESEEMQAKMAEGPVGMLVVFPNGPPNMGKLLGQQLAFFIVGCALIAYCAVLALPAGADYLAVFRAVSAIGFLAFAWAVIPYSIWFGHTWKGCIKFLIDGLVYALIVAGIFAWRWPGVAG